MSLSPAAAPVVPVVGPAPLVTVLINNFNYGRFLAAAIDSALNQTYPRVQVVVVDDGSTDCSRDVIRGYGDRVIPLLRGNRGQAAAINAGLQAVDGAVLVVLDADDELRPDVVERVVAEFAAEPSCVRVQYRLETIRDDGAPTGELVPPRHWRLLTGDLSRHVMRHRMFRSPPTSGNAWSLAALRRIPPAPEDMRTYVDRWWSELTTLLGPVRALEQPGGYYRLHPASLHANEERGVEYFRTRIALTERLHAAGRQVAAAQRLGDYPDDVDTPLDAALLAWRVAVAKLSGERLRGKAWWCVLRAAYAALVQPGQPAISRMRRAVWVLTLALAPRRGPLASRLADARYNRGTQ